MVVRKAVDGTFRRGMSEEERCGFLARLDFQIGGRTLAPVICDTFVIVSGDKDLIPAIRLLRERLGKEVIIAGLRHPEPEFNSLAYELDKEVDGMINLCSLVREIEPCSILCQAMGHSPYCMGFVFACE